MRKIIIFTIGFLSILIIGNIITETIPLNIISDNSCLQSDFSVMAYNVKCSSPSYKTNQVKIANEIIKESPDLVFLCEFDLWPSKELDSLLISFGGYNRYYKSGRNCVFYSKYTIDSISGINTGTFRNGHTLVNMVHLYLKSDTIAIVGCHLSSSKRNIFNAYRKRAAEADSIFKYIKNEYHPLVVIGDFNDFSGSYAINRIKEKGLKDAWWEQGCEYGATFHCGLLYLRLDHVLYQNEKFILNDVKVLDSDNSDHMPLVAKFKIK